MFQFVYWLRALAAILITNSHYADIWPASAMAFGGHYGNCIYFFLSGFCLYNIGKSFPKWYAKRIVRVYPALWIVAVVNLAVKFWSADGIMAYIHCFIYPTWYHFISSIMILYLVYYIMRVIQKKTGISMLWFLIAVLAVYLLMYAFLCDKSRYHIDDVGEHWCRFQLLASMLVGAYFRERYDRIGSKITVPDIVGFFVLTAAYFAGKIALSRVHEVSGFQFILPIIQVLLVGSTAVLFVKAEKKGVFERTSALIRKSVTFVAGLTLEIYLGQGLIIQKFGHLPFPINFIVVTGLILVYAFLIHKVAQFIQKPCDRLLGAGRTRGENMQ